MFTDIFSDLPCCQESPSQECRTQCESVLRRTGDSQEIAETLAQECGAPAIHDGLWQCFLRKDAPPDTKDLIPHDVAKLHCCNKVCGYQLSYANQFFNIAGVHGVQ